MLCVWLLCMYEYYVDVIGGRLAIYIQDGGKVIQRVHTSNQLDPLEVVWSRENTDRDRYPYIAVDIWLAQPRIIDRDGRP